MNEQVFISYSRKDTDWADRIKASLESNGIACWMDREGINAGEKYTRKIINAIKQCDIYLLDFLKEPTPRFVHPLLYPLYSCICDSCSLS